MVVVVVTDSLLTVREVLAGAEDFTIFFFLSRTVVLLLQTSSRRVAGSSRKTRRACWGPANITQLIRYLVALRLARGLPCVRSPRWSWAAIPHASSRVRPPRPLATETGSYSHKSYLHPHLQYLLLGPHEQLQCLCVRVCLARVSSRHLGLRPHKADLCRCLSITILSKHGLVLLHVILFLHTHYFPHATSARALSLARQHSRPDTLPLRALHDISMQLSALALCSHVSRCRLCALITICPAQIYTGIVEY